MIVSFSGCGSSVAMSRSLVVNCMGSKVVCRKRIFSRLDKGCDFSPSRGKRCFFCLLDKDSSCLSLGDNGLRMGWVLLLQSFDVPVGFDVEAKEPLPCEGESSYYLHTYFGMWVNFGLSAVSATSLVRTIFVSFAMSFVEVWLIVFVIVVR